MTPKSGLLLAGSCVAAIAAVGAGGLDALEMVDDLGPFSDPELERRRQRIRIAAVRSRASAALIAEVLEEVEAWAAQSGHPLALLSLAEGRARQRYHEGRFEEAAALHAEAAALDGDPRFRAVTGNIVFPGFTAPKLEWVRKHEPQIFDRVAKVLLPKAWLRWRLSGEYAEDCSDASGTLWLDVGARRWSEQALAA